jgi:hypothetical protein
MPFCDMLDAFVGSVNEKPRMADPKRLRTHPRPAVAFMCATTRSRPVAVSFFLRMAMNLPGIGW